MQITEIFTQDLGRATPAPVHGIRADIAVDAKCFDNFGAEIDEHLQSEAYLVIVRKAFRAWDQADTAEKRRMLANVVVNAGSTRACADDIVRLFIDWTELYNEVHFSVVRDLPQPRIVTL